MLLIVANYEFWLTKLCSYLNYRISVVYKSIIKNNNVGIYQMGSHYSSHSSSNIESMNSETNNAL